MFERFTHNAQTAVVLARDIARLRGHTAVGTGHLLSGLIHGTANSASIAIADLGIDSTNLRQRVDGALAPGSGTPRGNIPFTESAKQVLLLSLREALQLRHDHIGTEHVLLGLIRQAHGTAAKILNQTGVHLWAVRAHIERLPPRQVQAPPPPGTAVAADGQQPSLGRVFVLHRHDDLAPRVSADLDSTFHGHTGLVLYSDSTDLDPGQPSGALTAAISQCDVVLALIGPRWQTAVAGNGQRRIMQAADPVRTALETARSLNKPTVLALLDNVPKPRADDLPTSLATLLDRDPISIIPDTLHEHIAGLMRLYAPPS